MQILHQEAAEKPADLDTERVSQLSKRLAEHLGWKEEEVNIVFVDDEFIRELNRKYRQVDQATDVLCFDLSEPSAEEKTGEIYISLERAREQAKLYGVSLRNEVARLVVHGLLHLAGYDDLSDADREVMAEKTEEFLSLFDAN